MKFVVALSLFVALAVAAPQAKGGGYTTKYDNIDLDEILNNERLYKKYFSCLTNKAKCTPDGAELKSILPEALETACSKCNEKQRKGTEKVFKHLIQKRPQDYAELEKLYDPQGVYKRKYRAEAEKHGVKI